MKYYIALQDKFTFREFPKPFSKSFLAFGIILLAFVWMTSPYTKMCQLYAISSSQYCYKFDIKVSNSGGPTTYAPVRIQSLPIKSWVESNYVDKFAWSFYAYGESLSSEKDLMLQDITSNNATGWLVFTDLPQGDKTYSALVGSPSVQRNQGIFLNGSSQVTSNSNTGDYIRVANNNDFNDQEFEILLEFQNLSSTSQNGGALFGKYDYAQQQGFRVDVVWTGSQAPYLPVIRTTFDGVSNDLPIPTTNIGQNMTLRITKDVSNTVMVSLYDSNGYVQAYNVPLSTNLIASDTFSNMPVTLNNKDLYLGVKNDNGVYSQYIKDYVYRYFQFTKGYPSGTPVAFYGFNPKDMSETSASNPNYSGTITDLTGTTFSNTHNANYYFYRDQSSYSVSRSSLRSSTISASGIFTAPLKSIAGKWYGDSDPFTLAESNDNLLGLSFLRPAQTLQIPVVAWYSLWLSAFSVMILIGVFWIFRNLPIALLSSTIPYVIGGTGGLLPIWFVTIVFLIYLGIYSTSLWVERS